MRPRGPSGELRGDPCRGPGPRASRPCGRRRSFSLAELLLAIAILGIGVIAVAALFPAGIAQQQQSADDIMGPIVAESALAVLRTKLRPEMFGTFEEFGASPPLLTIEGDWPWLRPAFIFPGDDPAWPLGGIDVFNATGAASADESSAGGSSVATGIPYNTDLYGVPPGGGPPPVVLSQRERYYPMGSPGPAGRQPPQYVWDCMFRRFQGRLLVAIFVYRAAVVGGGRVLYSVPRNPGPSGATVPPLPVHKDVAQPPASAWDAWGFTEVNTPLDDPQVHGTPAGDQYDPRDHLQCWQEPGQWILDQNNNVHRVIARTHAAGEDARVELLRAVPALPDLPCYFFGMSAGQVGVENVVTNIWYVPTETDMDADGDGTPEASVRLFPVYVLVREL